MNYLLFTYYDNTVVNPEEKTDEIGGQISKAMTSKEVKFMFGDRHSIFHFASDLSLSEMGEFMNIVSFDQKFESLAYIVCDKLKMKMDLKFAAFNFKIDSSKYEIYSIGDKIGEDIEVKQRKKTTKQFLNE